MPPIAILNLGTNMWGIPWSQSQNGPFHVDEGVSRQSATMRLGEVRSGSWLACQTAFMMLLLGRRFAKHLQFLPLTVTDVALRYHAAVEVSGVDKLVICDCDDPQENQGEAGSPTPAPVQT